MAKKEVFQKGDFIDVKNRKLYAFGKIVKIKDDKATVHYKEPRRPIECEECGIGSFLSLNMGTGEIECLRSGCGHGHGFKERNEIIPLSQLINITLKEKGRKKEEFKSKVATILKEASKDGILDKEVVKKIIKLLS